MLPPATTDAGGGDNVVLTILVAGTGVGDNVALFTPVVEIGDGDNVALTSLVAVGAQDVSRRMAEINSSSM